MGTKTRNKTDGALDFPEPSVQGARQAFFELIHGKEGLGEVARQGGLTESGGETPSLPKISGSEPLKLEVRRQAKGDYHVQRP